MSQHSGIFNAGRPARALGYTISAWEASEGTGLHHLCLGGQRGHWATPSLPWREAEFLLLLLFEQRNIWSVNSQ